MIWTRKELFEGGSPCLKQPLHVSLPPAQQSNGWRAWHARRWTFSRSLAMVRGLWIILQLLCHYQILDEDTTEIRLEIPLKQSRSCNISVLFTAFKIWTRKRLWPAIENPKTQLHVIHANRQLNQKHVLHIESSPSYVKNCACDLFSDFYVQGGNWADVTRHPYLTEMGKKYFCFQQAGSVQ